MFDVRSAVLYVTPRLRCVRFMIRISLCCETTVLMYFEETVTANAPPPAPRAHTRLQASSAQSASLARAPFRTDAHESF